MATESVRSLADWYWQSLLPAHPLLATLLGDDRYDDRMPDLSDAARADELNVHADARRRAAAIDSTDLDQADRLDLAVISVIAGRELDAINHRFDRYAAGSQMGDAWRLSPGIALPLAASLQQASTPQAADSYVRRLRDFPRFLDQCIDLLREADRARHTQPRVALTRTLGQVKRILDTPVHESSALKPVAEAGDGARNAVIDGLKSAVLPAYQRVAEQLEASLATARDSLGLCGLEGGEELYAACIRYWTGLDVNAEAIALRGAADLEVVDADRRAVASSLGFDSPAAAADAYLECRLGPQTADELLRQAAKMVERSWELSKSAFGRRPARNCVVKLVDPSRAADVLAYYEQASEGRPAVFFVSPVGLDSRPTHRLGAWVAHEANPGHHFQIALEREATDRTDLRRFTNDLASSAFVEGWGLYAERLAGDLGLYTDDWQRLGLLDSQAFRCARLVVDTGIHAFGWSREHAIEALIAAGTPLSEAEIEVDRYAADPGQALTYRLGQIAIEECRRRLTANGQITARDFHDRVLALGSLPLPVMQRELTGAEFTLV